MIKKIDEWLVYKKTLDEETFLQALKNSELLGRKQALEDVKKEIIKRDLQNFTGYCYSIKDTDEGIGLPLLEWLNKLVNEK